MAKVRISSNMRDALNALARDWVDCPKERAATDATYTKAAPLVRRVVETKYPPKEMKVCAKYDLTRRDSCIRLSCADGVVREFTFHEKDEPPSIPDKYDCRNRIYLGDEALTAALATWIEARDAHKEAHGKKLADYRALITAAAYLEEIEAVWPKAADIRARFVANLPATVTEEVLSRIKTDVRLRLKLAA